ncbi:hypothetical protein [Peijinzhouia sedimentorum]
MAVEEFNLTGKEVGPTDFFGEPTSIISHDGYFILSDQRTQEKLHYLNESFNVVKSFGKTGKGPNDIEYLVPILAIQPFQDYSLKINTGGPIKEIDFSDSLNNLNFVNYPDDIVLTQQIVIVNHNTIWGQGGSAQFKFMVVDTQSGNVIKELPFVSFSEFFSPNILPYAYTGQGYFHPWWNRVVWSHNKLNTIEFYLPDGKFEKEWVFGQPWTEEELGNPYPVLLRSVPVPKGLLVMYIKEAKELAKSSTVANLYYSAIAKIKTRILFFNEDGEVKWSLKLDRFLNDFTFDVKNKRIVGIFGESEDKNIVVYELPEDLLKDVGF